MMRGQKIGGCSMCLECWEYGEAYHLNFCSRLRVARPSVWSFFRSPVYAAAIGNFLTPLPEPVKQVEAPAWVEEIVFKKAA
jgi:hypothetical protein